MFNKGYEKEILIEGMKCENCANHVKSALSSIDGVTKCDVSLKKNNATIKSDKEIDNNLIKEKVAEAGYNITKII